MKMTAKKRIAAARLAVFAERDRSGSNGGDPGAFEALCRSATEYRGEPRMWPEWPEWADTATTGEVDAFWEAWTDF